MANTSDIISENGNVSNSSIILAILTAIMSAFITFVNLLTIVVIRRTPSLRTLSNMYITSLALSDLVVGLCLIPLLLFFIPSTRVQLFDQNIPFCVLVFGINLGVAVVSNINMTLIAADRYIYITRPYLYKRAVNKTCVFAMMAGAWVFGALYALLPQLIHNRDVHSCDATLVMPVWYLFYTNLTMYSLLVITDLFLYSHIIYVAYRQRRLISVTNTSLTTQTTSPVTQQNLAPNSQQHANSLSDNNLIQTHQTKSSLNNQTHSHSFPKGDIFSVHRRANEKSLQQITESFLISSKTIPKRAPVNPQPSSSSRHSQSRECTQAGSHTQAPKGAGKLSSKQGNSRMKSVKFFMTVFGAYFVCLTPTIVCMGLDYYLPVPRFVYNTFNLLALLNSGINFIIYFTLNARFKMAVLRFLGLSQNTFIDVTDLTTNFDA